MAVLPENSIDLSGGVEFVAQPSLTWKIDRAAGRIAGTCDGYDAVKQAVEIILNVERYRWMPVMLPQNCSAVCRMLC